jgi:ABC-type multidrug transport system fused ATPase/permease subunit
MKLKHSNQLVTVCGDFEPQEMHDKQSLFPLLKILWKHISRRRRLHLVALVILMLLGMVAEVASLGMVLPFLGALTAPSTIFEHPWAQPIVNGLGLNSAQQVILPLTVLFGLAAAFSGSTRLGLLWWQTRLGNAIGNDLGSEAYRRTLYQPYVTHAVRNSSEVLAVLMTKINTVIYFIIIPLLTLLTSISIILTIMVFMMLVSPEITSMAFLGLGGLYFFVALVTKSRIARDSQLVTIGQNRLAQVIQEGLGGIKDVLIDGLQETYFRIYSQADGKFRRALANIAIIGGAPRPVIEAFGIILIGFLAYMLSSGPGGVANSIPMIGVLALAAQRLLPLVQQVYAGWASLLGGQASLRDVLLLLEQPLPAYSTRLPSAPMPFTKQIELLELNFRYNSQSPWVLHSVNLQISRGSRIGFVGTTGSGKSTLLDILMGLLAPTSGELRIDGNTVNESNRRAWQMHIAHVPQAIFLADTTINENIAFGIEPESIDKQRVREAAERAQLAETIESWQYGYDTLVGERGIRLSGGQRQRIGIARALYKRADVIVFDEATSALDNDTEHSVMTAINALGSDITALIVAHRVTTLQGCDQIVELRGGKIRKVGTYQEIIDL